jgi:hypothetical protein
MVGCTSDEMPTNKTIPITWENLTDVMRAYGIVVGFNVWNLKRGRVISFFDSEIFNRKTWDIKEWKEPDFDLSLETTFEEYTPSIQEVLEWHDGKQAFQYLKENGLSIDK